MIGVVGYAAPTGIGYLTRRLFKCLPAQRWLIAPHRYEFPDWLGQKLPEGASRLGARDAAQDTRTIIEFLTGLKTVVSVERTWPPNLFLTAKTFAVKTVLLVMGEWFDPRTAAHADVLIAPTRMCLEHLQAWGYGDKSVYIPIPLDLSEFAARQVTQADRLAFCNGWGGVDERKGAKLISEILSKDPGLLEVRSQRSREWPSRVKQRAMSDTPQELYADIDACIQPSRWEGLGLQQLEAMACGIPVLTTNAPPMSEHCIDAHGDDARRLLCPCDVSSRVVCIKPWPDAVCRVTDLLQMVRDLKGSAIADLSAQAITYTSMFHGERQWQSFREVCT